MLWIIAVICCALVAYIIYLAFSPSGFKPDSIRGKRVLITGASMGIGEELSYQYSRLGAKLFITGPEEHLLQNVKEKCSSLGAGYIDFIALDLIKDENRERLMKEATAALGGLDQLILNHTAAGPFGYWQGTADNMMKLTQITSINFFAYVHLASLAMPHLTESKGSIGVVSSVAGKMGTALLAPYSSTKHAIVGFFDGLRSELRLKASPVSITLVTFGAIASSSLKELAKRAKFTVQYAAPVEKAARAILEGVSSRKRDVIYPKSVRVVLFLRQLFPTLMENISAKVMSPSSENN